MLAGQRECLHPFKPDFIALVGFTASHSMFTIASGFGFEKG